MRFSSYLTAIVLAFMLTPSPAMAGVTSLDLPDFGDSSGSVISPMTEDRIGEVFMRNVRKNATIIDDPEVESYIRSLGYKLVANSDNNTRSFSFFVIKDPMINAFAAPGGIIGINSGVIINARTESELAGVVAHEIAHITQRHLARMFEARQQMSMPMLAAMIGSILLAVASPQAGQAAMTAVTGAQAQYGINFTRANEKEADSIGMQILARSGFDPRGMVGFFERLQQSSRYYEGNAPEFLRTHPLTTSRIAEARARAEDYPPVVPEETESFELIRMKLIATGQKNEAAAVNKLREMLNDASENERMPARYGYAIALTNANQFQAAREQIDKLLARDSEKPAFLLAAARLEARQQNYSAALEIYRDMERLYPNYRPLILAWTRTLLDAGKPQEARRLLRQYGRSNETGYQYYELLAQAESQSGNSIEGGIARAEYFYLIGDTSLAIERLKHTERQPGLDYYQQQRINARLEHFEQERALERELRI